jgi:hypothetical protein
MYELAAERLKSEVSPAVLARVRANTVPEIQDKYEISSEKKPTLKLFRYGEPSFVYENFYLMNDTQTAESIVTFMR